MTARRPAPVTETCHWECAWWATLAADRFAGEITGLATGALLTWAAHPGVRVGDVYLLATTAPDRRLRAWAWVVGAPDGDEDQGWRVTVRFGGQLAEPLRLRDLRADDSLAHWTPLGRVVADRLEGIPPAIWQSLRQRVQGPPSAKAAPAKPAPSAPGPLSPDPVGPQTWPWDGLGRGAFFHELTRRILLPQGYALAELLLRRDAAGIDLVAHRPEFRWTRWVAQLDVTGEAVDVESVHEVVAGRQAHGAQSGLLVATGPVTDSARSLAHDLQVKVWDAAWLRSRWLRPADGSDLLPAADWVVPVSSRPAADVLLAF
jgi:hypothetical protein